MADLECLGERSNRALSHRARKIDVGEIAVVIPPEPLAGFLAERTYLPHVVPLMKHVLALGGQSFCRRGAAITAHGKIYGTALVRDSKGRPLPGRAAVYWPMAKCSS
nr:S26 family signal peptidase [Mesorhizobium sp. CO1-1-8]